MLIITAPGQGAQTSGFLSPWLELPGVTEHLGTWSELAGCDLIRAGTTASADEIRDTAVAQPLLVAAGLIAAAVLDDGDPSRLPADAVAGHSVGELTAGVVAGVLTADEAMRLVGVRGAAMAAATQAEPTGMTAVLGGDPDVVLETITRHGLTPANVNGAGQVVAAGTLTKLAELTADPPAGARLRPLQVAGAFHTQHMAPAVEALRDAAARIKPQDPVTTLLSNADGTAVTNGKDWLRRIIGQVAMPVRWDECMRTMAALGVTAIIELPPAGTLTGLAKRAQALGIGPEVELLAVKTPNDINAARDLIAAHLADPAAASHGHLPEWRLIVAPVSGTFRVAAGDASPEGDPSPQSGSLGTIVARGDDRAITAPWPAEIIEWLVEDGDPVSEGHPLVRVLPRPEQAGPEQAGPGQAGPGQAGPAQAGSVGAATEQARENS